MQQTQCFLTSKNPAELVAQLITKSRNSDVQGKPWWPTGLQKSGWVASSPEKRALPGGHKLTYGSNQPTFYGANNLQNGRFEPFWYGHSDVFFWKAPLVDPHRAAQTQHAPICARPFVQVCAPPPPPTATLRLLVHWPIVCRALALCEMWYGPPTRPGLPSL